MIKHRVPCSARNFASSHPFLMSRNFKTHVANGMESNGLNPFLRIKRSIKPISSSISLKLMVQVKRFCVIVMTVALHDPFRGIKPQKFHENRTVELYETSRKEMPTYHRLNVVVRSLPECGWVEMAGKGGL